MLEMLHKFTEGRLGAGWGTEEGRGRCEDRKNPKSLSPVGVLGNPGGGPGAQTSLSFPPALLPAGPAHSLVARLKCIGLFLHMMGIDHS